MTFVGTFEHTLDAKGRLVLPAKIRGHLDGIAYLAPQGSNSIALWSPEEFEDMVGRITRKVRKGKTSRAVLLGTTANSEEVTIDKQGRVLIPERLRAFASLDRDVVLAGVADHVEIWNATEWSKQEAAINSQTALGLEEGLAV